MQLASILLVFVGLFVMLEKYSRDNAKYTSKTSAYKPRKLKNLSGRNGFLASAFCFFPIFVGFILPISELSIWMFSYNLNFFDQKFLVTASNTLFLGIISAILCSILALIMNFLIRLDNNKFNRIIGSLLSLGYAVPGLILAVGIVQLFVWLDRSVFSASDIVLTGSLIGLIVAYVIKSYALSNSAIESGYERISITLDESARTLKTGDFGLLSKIHFPLLKTSMLTSMLIVISEVVKELPATLILRPFNYETLAVSTYIYAAEERMIQASAPAVAIVLIGLIPIIILTKMIRLSNVGRKQ